MQTNAVRELLNADMKAARETNYPEITKELILSDTTTQSLFEICMAVILSVSTAVGILSDECRARPKLQR